MEEGRRMMIRRQEEEGRRKKEGGRRLVLFLICDLRFETCKLAEKNDTRELNLGTNSFYQPPKCHPELVEDSAGDRST
jgi:hypothetical protein